MELHAEEGGDDAEAAVLPRQRRRIAQDDLGAPGGDALGEAPPGHPDLECRCVYAGDVRDVPRLVSQEARRPAAHVQQVIVGLQGQVRGQHPVYRSVPDRHHPRIDLTDRAVRPPGRGELEPCPPTLTRRASHPGPCEGHGRGGPCQHDERLITTTPMRSRADHPRRAASLARVVGPRPVTWRPHGTGLPGLGRAFACRAWAPSPSSARSDCYSRRWSGPRARRAGR